jgi:hypothetical protein
MWVWHYATAVASPDARSHLIQFSRRNRINLLYVNTGKVLAEHPGEFSDLLKQAHANGIKVYALDGDPSWALTSNHETALGRIREVLDFNRTHPAARFDGIQHDIEPYALPEWKTDQEGTALQFLQLLKDSRKLLSRSGLSFTVTVPFWYDEGDMPVMVDDGTGPKPLSGHILDIADAVAVMDYRDSAGGTRDDRDGQIDHGKQEVAYAGSAGKLAILGAETNKPDGSGIPDSITYFDEGRAYMNAELQKVSDYFAGEPGFGGIAIHHYDTFAEMGE